VRVGVVFPQVEIGADAGGVRAYAQAAQDLGFDHLSALDHVLGADRATYPDLPGPYRAEHLIHEPFVLFGYLAGAAPKLELVTKVVVLTQRQAVLAAKQAAEIDILTGGKLRLGVGIGWNAVEVAALGMDFRNRARRFEEQIALMRQLWQEPLVTFEGKYHQVRAAGINPLPVQRPIPVWIGGSAEPALKRAAEIADGFFPQNPLPGGWAATLERMRVWRQAAGRDVATFGVEAIVKATGDNPDTWLREAEEWRALGATHIGFSTTGGGLGGADGHIARLRLIADAFGVGERQGSTLVTKGS
jgi:probable F420-dependent oxidoreductase